MRHSWTLFDLGGDQTSDPLVKGPILGVLSQKPYSLMYLLQIDDIPRSYAKSAMADNGIKFLFATHSLVKEVTYYDSKPFFFKN